MTVRDKLPNLVTAVIYGFAAMGAVRYLTLLPVLDGFRTDAGAAMLAIPLMSLGAALGWVFPLFPNAGQSTLFGSARWASKQEAAALTRNNGGLLIGRQQDGSRPLRYDGISHLITLAPTRTGMHPLAARKLRYYADGEFKGMFDPA